MVLRLMGLKKLPGVSTISIQKYNHPVPQQKKDMNDANNAALLFILILIFETGSIVYII